jgi:hypothetical protein
LAAERSRSQQNRFDSAQRTLNLYGIDVRSSSEFIETFPGIRQMETELERFGPTSDEKDFEVIGPLYFVMVK